jgi:hypothetical protein
MEICTADPPIAAPDGDAGHDHGGAAAAPGGDRRGEERGDEAGDVERGGEGGEQLAVEAAVVADALAAALHPPVHLREEPLQESVHRRHAACENSGGGRYSFLLDGSIDNL